MLCALLVGCKEDIYAPELPQPQSATLPTPVSLDAERIIGVWNTAEQTNRYTVEFTSVEDGDAILSHTFVNAATTMVDSVVGLNYTYTLSDGVITMTPSAEAALVGAAPITAIHIGNNQLELFATNAGYTNRICTLHRTSGPKPVITAVNKTLPQAGETVIVTGRNLLYVDKVFLPVADGWKEATAVQVTSKTVQFVVPAADYVQGAIRLDVTEDNTSVFSPAYMFATKGIFMHTFNEYGTTKADHYAGTEFEYTINDMGQLRSNANYLAAANLPDGHSLKGSSVLSPDSMLSFFGKTPVDWQVASGADDKKGYVRFSTGDRLQTVLARYAGDADAPFNAQTKCADLAIQMDLYVVQNGQPQWQTGYLSYRLNKNNSATGSASVANLAFWSAEQPMDFSSGWQTVTVPLSAFSMTNNLSLEAFINTLLTGNLQTIFTFMNYELDALHPATAVTDCQFSIANLRLVPIK